MGPWTLTAKPYSGLTSLPSQKPISVFLPGDLYYPLEKKASREGRRQEFAAEALEKCGCAYFLPADAAPAVPRRGKDDRKNDLVNPEHLREGLVSWLSARGEECRSNALMLEAKPVKLSRCNRLANKRGKQRTRRLMTLARSGPAVVAKTQALEQSQGLRWELKHAVIAARSTFREGDRVESRWRRPARMDRACLDPNAWHPGRVINVSKDGNVDITFEGGDKERLKGIPDKHVRLAPQSLPGLSFVSCPESILQIEPITCSSSKMDFSCQSRRELAHAAITMETIRRTWEDPLTMKQELSRLREIWEERMRSRPAWRGSFSALNFQATKKGPIGGGATPAVRSRPKLRGDTAKQHSHARYDKKRRRTIRTPPRVLHTVSDYHGLAETSTRRLGPEKRENFDSQPVVNALESSKAPFVPPSLVKAQSDLVAAVMVYDNCMSTVLDCLEREVSCFNAAQTYSELQRDWRGNAIVGLQSATLDVVEAMEAWSMERAAVSGKTTVVEEKETCSVAGAQNAKLPLFLWEGSPLVSTIIAHSAMLFERAPQLKAWYGARFPVKRNPFFLAYSIDDRPATPRNAFVRTDLHSKGKIATSVSDTLITEKRKEKAAMKAVLDRQAAAPRWWPAAGGAMSKEHCRRIRQAEKVLLQEERNATDRHLH